MEQFRRSSSKSHLFKAEMAEQVRRDIHKMRAFVRFREVTDDAGPRYVAWFEPEHHIVRANINCLISLIALAGFKPFGQVRAQFIMVWHRYRLMEFSSIS